MGPENGKDFQLFKSTVQRNRVPAVVLQRHEFSQHIPNVNLTSGDAAFVETDAGALYADRAVRAAQVSYCLRDYFLSLVLILFLKTLLALVHFHTKTEQ